MKIFIILILLFVISCSKDNKLTENNKFSINMDLPYEVLKEKIIDYGKNSNYPDISN